MKTQNKIKEFSRNFLKCGVAGWCLEVIFTSVGSIAAHDWRLMGNTSLLMFPIYGLGALLTPIGQTVDRWLQVTPGEVLAGTDRLVRHGMLYMVIIFVAEYLFGMLLKAGGVCPWDYSEIGRASCRERVFRAV